MEILQYILISGGFGGLLYKNNLNGYKITSKFNIKISLFVIFVITFLFYSQMRFSEPDAHLRNLFISFSLGVLFVVLGIVVFRLINCIGLLKVNIILYLLLYIFLLSIAIMFGLLIIGNITGDLE